MALIHCPECDELTVRGQPVEWSSLWEYECWNGHVWREPDPEHSDGCKLPHDWVAACPTCGLTRGEIAAHSDGGDNDA